MLSLPCESVTLSLELMDICNCKNITDRVEFSSRRRRKAFPVVLGSSGIWMS